MFGTVTDWRPAEDVTLLQSKMGREFETCVPLSDSWGLFGNVPSPTWVVLLLPQSGITWSIAYLLHHSFMVDSCPKVVGTWIQFLRLLDLLGTRRSLVVHFFLRQLTWSLVAHEDLAVVPIQYKCCLCDFACIITLFLSLDWAVLLLHFVKECRHQIISNTVLRVTITLKMLKSNLGTGGGLMILMGENGATPYHVLLSRVPLSLWRSVTKS